MGQFRDTGICVGINNILDATSTICTNCDLPLARHPVTFKDSIPLTWAYPKPKPMQIHKRLLITQATNDNPDGDPVEVDYGTIKLTEEQFEWCNTDGQPFFRAPWELLIMQLVSTAPELFQFILPEEPVG